MNYKTSIFEKQKVLNDLSLKYMIFKRDIIVEDTICTTFDVQVEKHKEFKIEKAVCPAVSNDLNLAISFLNVLYENEVLPENLLEISEECFEIIL